MDTFTPSRLTLARMRRAIRQQELAERCSVDARTVRAWEKGEWPPDEGSLQNLVRVLRFPRSFFFAPAIELIDLDTASFRSLTTLRAAQRDAVHAAGTLTIPLHEWIKARFRLPKLDVPSLRDLSPELAAAAVRTEWGLGDGVAPNMVHLLEYHGVRVFSAYEEVREFDAFSFWADGHAFVMLNTLKSAERGRFDAAHELGHLVLHRDGSVHGPEAEQQADRFASAFLLPEKGIAAQRPRSPSLKTVLVMKGQWQVSVAAMAHRLSRLGYLSEWQYREMVIEIQRRGWRTSEPEPMKKRETSQVLAKVFGPLRREDETPQSVAREIHLPVDEVQRMVFGLVLTDAPPADALPAPPPAPPKSAWKPRIVRSSQDDAREDSWAPPAAPTDAGDRSGASSSRGFDLTFDACVTPDSDNDAASSA